LNPLIQSALAKVAAERDAARSRKDAADRTLASRQALVRNSFNTGKALFEEGKYSEAMKQWVAIADELEEGDKVRKAAQEVEAIYAQSIAAQDAAAAAEAEKDKKLPAPAGLSTLLIEIGQKIQAQTQAQQDRKAAAEKALSERRAALDASFARGKVALDEGRIEEALKEWEAMLSELDDDARLRQTIADIRAQQETLRETAAGAKAAAARQDAKIAAPEELERALSDFFAKVNGETELAKSQRETYDAEFEERKTRVRNTYLKGLALFNEGKYPDALNEWSGILPQLEEEAHLKELILKANRDFENLALAQKAVFDAEARRGQKIPAPEELAQHMKTAVDKIKLESVDKFSEILDQGMQAANIDKEALELGQKKFKTPSDISTELADMRGTRRSKRLRSSRPRCRRSSTRAKSITGTASSPTRSRPGPPWRRSLRTRMSGSRSRRSQRTMTACSRSSKRPARPSSSATTS
jgi:lipopolysaccharide biosynthesis regulator YciM